MGYCPGHEQRVRTPPKEEYLGTVQGAALQHVAEKAAELAVRVRLWSAAAELQLLVAKGYSKACPESEQLGDSRLIGRGMPAGSRTRSVQGISARVGQGSSIGSSCGA